MIGKLFRLYYSNQDKQIILLPKKLDMTQLWGEKSLIINLQMMVRPIVDIKPINMFL